MAGTITRAQLTEAVYQEVGLSRNESSELVESLLSGCFIVTTNVGEQQYYLHPNRRLVLNNSSNFFI